MYKKLLENNNNIDEQLQKLRDICDEAHKKYTFYDNEYEAETEEGFVIHQDLIDKLNKAAIDQKKTVDNYQTFLISCERNKVDLTNHWLRLGFSLKEIQKMSEEV